MRKLIVATTLILGAFALGAPAWCSDIVRSHRVAIQVDTNDAATMNLALNNAANVVGYYKERNESVQVEVVAYGPGLNMLRTDTSPVSERIRQLSENSPAVAFSACGNTQAAMAEREGKPIPIVSQARIVPSGAVRLMELQEQGWSYLRP